MNFDFSDEQKMLREQARRFLSASCDFAHLRTHLASEDGVDRTLWHKMAELGWTGVAVPEEFGGLGLGVMELCVLAEELGRVLAPVPFLATACSAVTILVQAAVAPASDLLEQIAGGSAIVAVAALAQDGLELHYADGHVSGVSAPLAYALQAEHAIVRATDAAGSMHLLLLAMDASGVQRSATPGIDRLQPHGRLTLTAAPVIVLASGAAALAMLAVARNQAAVLTAFEQIGGADAACKLTSDYVKERFAFGRAVGGYQAVKHKMADMAVKIELARSNAYFGAWAMADGADELDLAAAAARLSATEAFEYAAQECLHLHGGIGYTWEANCHFFYTRSRLLAVTLGNGALWAERLLGAASKTLATA